MSNPLRILYLEDSPLYVELVSGVLEGEGITCCIVPVDTRESFLAALAEDKFDLILADYTLPDFDGITALTLAKEKCPDVPFIIISGTIGEEVAVDTLKSGATDYILKQRLSRLVPSIRRVLLEIEERAERRRAEAALARLRRQNELLLHCAGDGIYGLDLQGNTTFVNPAAAKMVGWEVHELMGQSMHSLLRHSRSDGTPYPPEACPMCAAVKDGTVYQAAHEVFRRKDGTGFPVEYISTPIREQGELMGAVATFHDITERLRAAEEMKMAKEAAEAANRSKSEFLANMSHEIRTPMNGIIGMTELSLDTELTAEQREYLDLVKSSAYALLEIINDILDFSKIDVGKLCLDHTDFHLQASLQEAMRTLALRAEQKGLKFVVQWPPDSPDALTGDPDRLRQVLVNLIGNAIKFTEQGEVTVRLETTALTADEAELHFVVQDTGIGIPAEKQRAIFDAFTQADGSSTRRFGGAGLGLTISSKLIELMGGQIWVESEVDKGSAFHVVVRLDRQKEPAPALIAR